MEQKTVNYRKCRQVRVGNGRWRQHRASRGYPRTVNDQCSASGVSLCHPGKEMGGVKLIKRSVPVGNKKEMSYKENNPNSEEEEEGLILVSVLSRIP